MTIKSEKDVYKNLDFSLHNVSTAKGYGLITSTQVTVCECNMKRQKTLQLKWSTKHCTDGKVTFSQCMFNNFMCMIFSLSEWTVLSWAFKLAKKTTSYMVRQKQETRGFEQHALLSVWIHCYQYWTEGSINKNAAERERSVIVVPLLETAGVERHTSVSDQSHVSEKQWN